MRSHLHLTINDRGLEK
uniref:Uncharacterized protein n=1 Tax=Salix viminalis TaxID=40686 RepID=A0A6N2L4F4_SALVM